MISGPRLIWSFPLVASAEEVRRGWMMWMMWKGGLDGFSLVLFFLSVFFFF